MVVQQAPNMCSSNMADVRDPVGVGFDGDGVTSPQSRAATHADVHAAARVLDAENTGGKAGLPRLPAHAIVGGGLLIALLIALVVSVVWVSTSSKHPLVQPIPSPPTTTAASPPGPSVANGPLVPPPAPEVVLPPPPINITAPVQTAPPSTVTSQTPVTTPMATPAPPPVTAPTATPAPRPKPRLPRLRDVFPRLFPNG